MRNILLFILLLMIGKNSNSQTEDYKKLFDEVPIKDGAIIYEKVFNIDSVNDKDRLFNAVKATLIKNTNYKYSKIDEDRTAGSISTSITFEFSNKPNIITIYYTGVSQLTIDIKENRFRVRLFNNAQKTSVLGIEGGGTMEDIYKNEKKLFDAKKWKEKRSVVIPWHKKLSLILEAFGLLVYQNLNDTDF